MRIIAGTAKGTRLVSPTGGDVRPTLDRVREACFSILGPSLPGARFLDLFAGTGANGLEALSRGAAHADFVEHDRRARALIEENIARTKTTDRARVYMVDLPDGLARLKGGPTYDVVYADPPHRFEDFSGLFSAIAAAGLVSGESVVVLEHASRTPIAEGIDGFHKARSAVYGESTLSFFRLADPAAERPNPAS